MKKRNSLNQTAPQQALSPSLKEFNRSIASNEEFEAAKIEAGIGKAGDKKSQLRGVTSGMKMQ